MQKTSSLIVKLRGLFLALLFIAAIFLTVGLLKKHGYAITYAVTVSMPKGWYLIVSPEKIARHDIVQFKPPEQALNFLHKEHLIPRSDLLLKYVVGLPDDFVCNKNGVILVSQKKFGTVYQFDSKGIKLPKSSFCGKLGHDQYLLLSDRVKNSFDGRYFGPIYKKDIIGRAVLLLKRD